MASSKAGAKAEAAVDVRRTLKFIGRLAVRLQANAETSTETHALEEALQEAVSNLPDGVVRRTLESDLDRFGRALVDRVASLQSGKEKGAVVQDAGQHDLDGLAARELVSEAAYQLAVDTLISRWGEVLIENAGEGAKWREGELDGELDKWRYLSLKILAARPSVPEKLAVAHVNLEMAMWREGTGGGGDRSTVETYMKLSAAETVTSSVLQSSAFLSPESRLALLSALATLLSNTIEALIPSAAELHTTSAAKRLQKLARTLVTVHSSQLKQSVQPPADAFRTGALLAVALLVTRYLFLTSRSEGRLGDAGLAKLRQTAAEAQAGLTVGEREALVGLLCEPEEAGAVRALEQEGGYAVRGALYEASLRVVPFQEVDQSLGASLGRVELARKAVAMFRSNGDRSRASAILTAVLNSGSLPVVAAAAKARLERLRAALPHEGLPSDPRGLATWLITSASDSAFSATRAALQSQGDPANSSTDCAQESVPRESPAGTEEEPLFYIDKTGSGAAVDPAESQLIAAVEQIAQAGPSKSQTRSGRKLSRAQGGDDAGDESEGSDESEKSDSDQNGSEGESDGDKRPEEELGRAGLDESPEDGNDDSDKDERPGQQLVTEMDEKAPEDNQGVIRLDEQSQGRQAQAGTREEKSEEGGSDEGGSSDEDKSSDGGDSSDEGLHENAFIARMPFRPLDESSESESEEERKRQKERKNAPRPVPVGIPIPSILGTRGSREGVNTNSAGMGPTTEGETRWDEGIGGPEAHCVQKEKQRLKSERAEEKKSGGATTAGKAGPVKVGLKRKVANGAEAADDISPLHTRSGRSLVTSPGPGSVSKKTPGVAGRRKGGLSAVAEHGGAGEAGKESAGGKKRTKNKVGEEEAAETGGEQETAKVGGSGAGVPEREPEMAQKMSVRSKPEAPLPSTVKKGQMGDAIAAQEEGAEEYVSPLHTRSGKVVAPPSTVKKTVKKKRGVLDGVLEEGRERDVSPLHTRSGKAIGAETPVPKSAQTIDRAAATPVASVATVKRTKKQ